MVDFILLLIITSLWIWGIHGFYQLTKLADALEWLPSWFKKPLWDCPPCCSSFHGTVAFMAFHHDLNLLLWPVFCICLCGLNYIIKEFLYAS